MFPWSMKALYSSFDLIPRSGSNDRALKIWAGPTKAKKPIFDAKSIVVTRRVRLFERDFKRSLFNGFKNDFFIIKIFKINVKIQG